MTKKIRRSIFLMTIFILFISWEVVSLGKYDIETYLLAGKIFVDRQAPQISVLYSTKEWTAEPIVVTLEIDEVVKPIVGWQYVQEENKMYKTYTENIQERLEVEDLSGNITTIEIKIENILQEGPSIEVCKIENTNPYPLYANQKAEITIILSIHTIKNIQKEISPKDIQVQIGDKVSKTAKIEVESKDNSCQIHIKNIQEEGNLQIFIPKGSLIDEQGLESEQCFIDTKMIIDNTSPIVTTKQEVIEEGIVKMELLISETIRDIEGWEKQNDRYYKLFQSNVSYILPVMDLAGNESKVKIEVNQASHMQLRYASHNSEIGWTFGYGNYDIAGLEAIKTNPKYKTECIAFGISGQVEANFLQGRAYVHTYWGEGSVARCTDTKLLYHHGYNPNAEAWNSMASATCTLKDKRPYFTLGGAGINWVNNTDIDGKNPIPSSTKNAYLFGVSGIQLQLKDTSAYSVVYQIYVEEKGWLLPKKNGELIMYQKDKPMSAIRAALIPNSEVEYLLNTWEKDTANKVK